MTKSMSVSFRVGDRKRGCLEEEFQVAGVIWTPTFNPSPAKQGGPREPAVATRDTVSLHLECQSVSGFWPVLLGVLNWHLLYARQPVPTALGLK